MRDEHDISRSSSQSPIGTANGSSANGKDVHFNASTNGKTTSNRASATLTNGGNSSHLRFTQPTFYGHDREEVTRILIQGLTDLGYEDAAATLSHESGYDLETPYASAFRIAVLQGDWPEAEALLSDKDPLIENGGVRIGLNSYGHPHTQRSGEWRASKSYGRLSLAPEADKREMLFLIRRQKYLELLEERDLGAALMVLRQELQPLGQDERQLHALSSWIMCQSSDDLKLQAEWDGAQGESRKLLLSDLSRFISPSVMIPEHRMAELLAQIKEAQVQNCLYHNDPHDPSLYMNHECDRQDFPLDTICELDQHRDEVWFLQFSNDGTKLATASKDYTVVIYETTTFRYLHRLTEHGGPVAYLAWSPDDSRLVTCSQEKSAGVKLWDVATGTCLRTLRHHSEPVTTAAWAPDGKTFVTGSLDIQKPLTIWPADLGPDPKPIHNFEGVLFRVQDCAIGVVTPPTLTAAIAAQSQTSNANYALPTRMVVVTTSTERLIHVFDYTHRIRLAQIQMEFGITCLNLSRDGHEMLLNLSSGEVWAMNVDTCEIKQKFHGQKQGQFVIKSCYGGAREGCVVSGGEDAKICIWHRYTGRLLEQLDGHRGGCVNAVAWNTAKSSMFASAGDDHKVRIWSMPLPHQQLQQIQQSHSQPTMKQSQDQTGVEQAQSHPTSFTSSSADGHLHSQARPPMWGDAALMRR